MNKQGLTQNQQTAANNINKSFAVIAGAGSGKTTVLVERLANIIKQDNSLDNFLAITFTEKAAHELKSRLRKRLPTNLSAQLSQAWIGTFHGFCARLLRTHAPLIKLDPFFNIIDENHTKICIKQAIEQVFIELLDNSNLDAARLIEEFTYKNSINLLTELMNFRWHAQRVLTNPQAHSSREKNLHESLAKCFAEVQKRFNSQINKQNQLDFQALEICTLELLENKKKLLTEYQQKFKHILVDEYQDTNDIQTQLVNLLFSSSQNKLFIVGDPRQSIYRFRGANVGCFTTMTKTISASGGEIISLNQNFRSRPAIVNLANIIAKPLEKTLFDKNAIQTNNTEIDLIAARENSKSAAVTKLLCKNKDKAPVAEQRRSEADMIAKYILQLTANSEVNFGDITCLFQAITASDIYEQSFRKHGVPYRTLGSRNLLEQIEVSDLLAALEFSANSENNHALLTLARSPLIGLSDDECTLLAGTDGKQFRNNIFHHQKSAETLNFLVSAKETLNPSEILLRVMELSGYQHVTAGLDKSGGRQAYIDKFFSLVRSLESNSKINFNEIISFIKDLRSRNARLGEPISALESTNIVKLMTTHASKGLEFPVVILPDLIRKTKVLQAPWRFIREEGLGLKWKNKNTPLASLEPSESFTALNKLEKQAEAEENRRLLYVALTRAQNKLVLPLHETCKAPWHLWVNEAIGEEAESVTEILQSTDNADQHLSPDDTFYIKPTPHFYQNATRGSLNINKVFSVSQLESFERCPQEFYLKYILQLPANIHKKSATKKIPANLRGSIAHSVLEKLRPDNLSNLPDLISLACQEYRVKLTDDLKNELSKLADNFSTTPYFSYTHTGFRELRFDWKIYNFTITGKIDWLKPLNTSSDNEYEIIDFKTDRLEKHQLEDKAKNYQLQMIIYALASEAALQKTVKHTSLFFLHTGQVHQMPITDALRNSAASHIKQIVDRISLFDYDLGKSKPSCFQSRCTCPYHLNKMCWLDKSKTK